MVFGQFIRDAAHLRRAVISGRSTENEVIEFKLSYDPRQPRDPKKVPLAHEAARDIAGFANSGGGAIIVGVDETEGSDTDYRVAKEIMGVENPEAAKEWLDDAPRQFLVPRTLAYSIDPIQFEERAVLVVNVVPDPGGSVAVWSAATAERMEFPYRTSVGKKYMNPDDIARRMGTGVRATAVTLRRLADATDKKIVVLASLVKTGRSETDVEYNTRLGALRVTQGLRLGDDQKTRIRVYEGVANQCAALLNIGETEFELQVKAHHLTIPYALVRSVWRTADGLIGMIVSCDVVLPDRNFGQSWLDTDGRLPVSSVVIADRELV
jgi:hypothetical protein